MQVKRPLLDNLAQGFSFETERREWDIRECPARIHTHCQGRRVLHHILQQGNTVLSPSNNLTPCIQKKRLRRPEKNKSVVVYFCLKSFLSFLENQTQPFHWNSRGYES